jgi:hypothetical protein
MRSRRRRPLSAPASGTPAGSIGYSPACPGAAPRAISGARVRVLTDPAGGMAQGPKVVDGQAAVRAVPDVTLAIDHNGVDGAPATRSGAELRDLVERAAMLSARPDPDAMTRRWSPPVKSRFAFRSQRSTRQVQPPRSAGRRAVIKSIPHRWLYSNPATAGQATRRMFMHCRAWDDRPLLPRFARLRRSVGLAAGHAMPRPAGSEVRPTAGEMLQIADSVPTACRRGGSCGRVQNVQFCTGASF